MGFVIPIGWKYMARSTVKIFYEPNIRNSFCYRSICLISTFVYIKNGSEFLIRGTAEICISLMIFFQESLVSRSCLISLTFVFADLFFFHLRLFDRVCFKYSKIFVILLSSFGYFSFSIFHYVHDPFFYRELHFNILTVYSHCFYPSPIHFQFCK